MASKGFIPVTARDVSHLSKQVVCHPCRPEAESQVGGFIENFFLVCRGKWPDSGRAARFWAKIDDQKFLDARKREQK